MGFVLRKARNMENSLKSLILAASISITCMVVSLGFYTARQASEISSITTQKLNNITISLEEDEYLKYDGLAVLGSDVVNFIYRNLSPHSSISSSPVYIYVDNGLEAKTFSNNENIKETKDFTSNYYIHPLGKYRGQVIRNGNDVITGIAFIVE